MVKSIENLTRGTGTLTEDGWFYGSSVYLASTIFYTTSSENGFNLVHITKVTISCSVNSGTTISSMSLSMEQRGMVPDGSSGTSASQQKSFNATTTRTFSAPSNWIPVLFTNEGSKVSAHLTATAVRQAGTATFTLYNFVVGG